MKPRIHFITLPVKNLHKSLRFYKDGLGLPTQGIQEGFEDHVLFELENATDLVLCDRDAFLESTGNPNKGSIRSGGFIISHQAENKAKVDQIVSTALAAGATQVGSVKDEPWGYSANFADPDGHQWEIIFLYE